MDSSKIKKGDRLAFSASTRGSRYGSRWATQCEVVEVLGKLDLGEYNKYAQESNLREQYGVRRVQTYRGKAHFVVQLFNEDGTTPGRRHICSSQNLPMTWAAYAKKNDEAKARMEARVQAQDAQRERAEAVVANLEALGITAEVYGGTRVLLSAEGAEALVEAVQ